MKIYVTLEEFKELADSENLDHTGYTYGDEIDCGNGNKLIIREKPVKIVDEIKAIRETIN